MVTTEDLDRIEETLQLRLPESYRSRLQRFPIPAAAGNSDLGVWDDPDRLIEFNLELRRGAPGGVQPWPSTFFAIGHAGDGCPYALNLEQGDAVWWVEYGHLANPASGLEAESFAAWADDYFTTLRAELTGEGIDPAGAPAQRAAAEAREVHQQTLGCLWGTIIIGAIVVALLWWIKS